MKKAALTILILAAFNYLYSANLKDMGKIMDLSGHAYGRLAVISFDRLEKKKTYWNCLCQCGKIKSIQSNALRSGATKSCGCLHHDAVIQAKTIHQGSYLPEYRIWRGMKTRCNNKNDKSYPDYGGRGIKILWNNFADFIKDVGSRPSEAHSIDRIDYNGHYGPENVKWSTSKEQNNNTRFNLIVNYKGETLNLTQLTERFGLKYMSVWKRISELGWSVENAIEIPIRSKYKNKS